MSQEKEKAPGAGQKQKEFNDKLTPKMSHRPSEAGEIVEKENKIVKSFYMPETFFEWSKDEAERMGVPQNAFLLQLMHDGKKYRELIDRLVLNVSCPYQCE